jgi:two-component system cell cycle sensor histidine kinase/response regulator CckA
VGLSEMLRRLIGVNIELVMIPATDLHPIKVDPGQIEQVIMNLVVNARDAMPAGGRLTIEAANADLDAEYVARHPGARIGSYVRLSVTDTGVGMNAETRSRLFEPFFTTKEEGKGTGLGLATVFGIVKQSGAYIAVHTEVGRGSVFEVYFPRVDD